jgi:hypothetical protein
VKRVPLLSVVVPLEERAQLVLFAESHEDELRLRAWLRRTPGLERLQQALVDLLDELDDVEIDHGDAA